MFTRRPLLSLRLLSVGLLLVTLMPGSFGVSVAAQGMPGVINPLLYPGTDLCLQIQAAIAANASSFPQGLIIDARSATGIQQCTVNPFAGATVSGQLLLGATVLQTSAPIVTPSIFAWQILGVGRGNTLTEPPIPIGTMIQARSTPPAFPANNYVVRLGDGGHLTSGNRITNLAIDCNSVSGAVGLYSTDIQEQSGGSDLVITNCPSHGLWINGSGMGVYPFGVPPFADNYSFHDVEVYGPSGSPSTVGCEFDGNFTNQGNGPHTVNALTCNGAVTDFLFDSITDSHISNLNAENATVGYLIGSGGPLNGVSFDGLNSGTIAQTVVHIQNVVSARGNFTQGLSFTNIVNGGAVAPVTLQDDVSSTAPITLHDFILGRYSLGSKLPRSGAGYTSNTSSLAATNLFAQVTSDNGSDSPNALKIGSGNTSSQASIIEFDDRGNAAWNMGRDSSGDFQIFDFSSGVLRFFAPTGSFPYTGIASLGAAPILFNLFPGSGTGGISFGSGGSSPTTVANITSTGAATFSSLYVPSLGASTRPLCTTTGGLIVNVGCSAPGEAAAVSAHSTASTTPGVTSAFGRTGSVAASTGDYSVDQVTGAAPSDSPSFTGTLVVPSIAGVGAASFIIGNLESAVGNGATAACAIGRQCDSYSGTVQFVTGSGAISSAGEPIVTINLPLSRVNLPNCVVTLGTNSGKIPVAFTLQYPSASSILLIANSLFSPSSVYQITYLCGGN